MKNLKLHIAPIGVLSHCFYIKNLALFTFVFSILFFTSFQSNAADYYWVGGSGNWTDLSHWSNGPTNPGGFYAVQPQSTDNVFFTSSSGFTVVNKTVALPGGTSSTCKNLNFATGIVGFHFVGGPTATFASYGNVTLEPNMDFTSGSNPVTSWNGATWEFYQSSDGSTRTFQTANNNFIQSFSFKAPSSGTGGDFIVNGTLSVNNTRILVDLQAATHQVTFNNFLSSVYMVNGNFIEVVKGILNTNQGVGYSGVNYGGSGFTVRLNGQWNNYGIVDAIGLAFIIEGKVYLNAGNTLAGNVCKMWTLQNGVLQTPISVLDFNHCSVNIYNSFSFGRYGLTTSIINAANSTLNFMPGSLTFYISNHTFNNVNVLEDLSTFFNCYIADQFNSVQTPAIDSLIVDRNTTFPLPYVLYTAARGKLQITGLQRFTAGHQYVGGYNGTVHQNEFDLVSGATLDMQGTCENPITLKDTKFDLTGVGTSTVNNIAFDGTNIAIPGTYPAGSGSIQVSGSSLTGWTVGARIPRILVWVADQPSSTTNAATYGNWYNSDHWLDVTSNPTWALNPNNAPGAVGNTLSLLNACPPTEIDSVIFPNNSYVRCDKTLMYSEGMNWFGTGRIFGAHPQDIQVWGALNLSPQMINDFSGTFEFKSNRTYRCAITTNNQAFDLGVKFNSSNGLGEWLLMDNLNVPNYDNFTNAAMAASNYGVWVAAGHLYTGTLNCTSGNGKTITTYGFRFEGASAKLSLFDSDVYIKGLTVGAAGIYINNLFFGTGGQVNCGTSNFIIDPLANGYTHAVIYGAHTLYDITVKRNGSLPIPTAPTTAITLFSNVKLHTANSDPTAWMAIATYGALANASYVQKIINNSTNFLGFRGTDSSNPTGYAPPNIGTSTTIKIDSLITLGNLDMGINSVIYSYIQLPVGSYNTFGSATLNTVMTLAGASSFVSPYLNTCPGGATINYPGARAIFSGSCFGGSTTIKYGSFVVNSSLIAPFSYLAVDGNSATGPNAPLTANLSSFNATLGWIGSSSAPRKLRWVDPSGLAANSGNWFDGNYWEQIYPTYAAAPQCPPTKIDTAWFNATSFSANNQKVQLTGPVTEIATMIWENIPATKAPQFNGALASNFYVFASLYFDNNMVNNTFGEYNFVGTPSINFPQFNLKSGIIPFNNHIRFTGGADLTTWNLQDVVNMPPGKNLYLNRGKFYTHGYNMTIGAFQSIGTLKRYIDIENTTVTMHSASGTEDWSVGGTIVNGQVVEFNINAKNSILHTLPYIHNYDGFRLGGKKYNTIISTQDNGNPAGCFILGATTKDSVNYFRHEGTILSISGIQVDSIYIKKSEFYCPMAISSKGGSYDSLYFYNNGKFSSNNKYHNLLHFEPGKQYLLDASTVQWIQNKAELELNGITNTSKIQLFGTTIGSQGYIRKDSAAICADFVDIKDVWAVGNGNDPANSCTSYGNSPVNNFTTHPNPWIVSMADTITDITASCGPWFGSNPSTFNRGRADFNLGASADLIGGNSFGWGKRPLSALPLISLGSYVTKEACEFDTLLYTIEIVGDLPIKFTTHYVIDGDTIPTTIFVDEVGDFVSGTGLSGDPFIYVDTLVMPLGIDTIYVTNLQLEANRCFDNYSENLQTWTIIVNPTPVDLAIVTNPASAIFCPGSSVLVSGSSVVSNLTYSLTTTTPTFIGSHLTGGSVATGPMYSDTNFLFNAVSNKGCKAQIPLSFAIGDFEVPVIDCPNDTIIYLGNSCDITLLDYSTYAGFTASDNCTAFNDLIITQIPPAGTHFIAETDTVIYIIVEDESGNKDTCSFALQIQDTIAPTIICNGAISIPVNVSCEYQVPSILAEYSSLSDNCTATSSIVLTQSIVSGTDTSGVAVVWLVATDEYGNSDSCSVTLNPVDTIDPVLAGPFPADTTINCDQLVPAAVIMTATDNCGTPVVTVVEHVIPGVCANSDTIIRTYTATDGAGNTDVYIHTIIVQDTTKPVFVEVLPQDTTVNCDAIPTAVVLTATDNCSATIVVDFDETITPGTCANAATITRTWTVEDECNNVVTHVQVLTVQDTVAPIFVEVLPTDTMVNCDAIPIAVVLTATDNCSVTIVVDFDETITPRTCANAATITRTWTVEDECNNVTTHVQILIVQDTTKPVFVEVLPVNITVDCDAVPTAATLTATDNCTTTQLVVFTEDTLVGSCANAYTLTRTWIATDECANMIQHVQTVMVQDTIKPVFVEVLPTNITVNCDAVPTAVTLTATDNCTTTQLVVFTEDTLAGSCANAYTLTRTWTATDECANMIQHVQTVMVQDTTKPVFVEVLPTNITVNCDAVPTAVTLTATDNCTTTQLVVFTEDTLAGSCANTYTLTRTWSATDECNNVTTHTQTVSVQDTTAPIFTGLLDQSVSTNANCEFVIPDFTTSITDEIDNCSATVTLTQSPLATTIVTGNTTVVITATDVCGNSTNHSFVLSVSDLVAPIASCQNVAIYLDATGNVSIDSSTINNGSTDNCSIEMITLSQYDFDCSNVGTPVTVTMIVTDFSGNSSSCDAIVTVEDTLAPIASCQNVSVYLDATGNISIDSSAINNGSTDNCGIETITLSQYDFDCSTIGSPVTVTMTVTDVNGNISTCDAIVTVEDTLAPIATCQNVSVYLDETGNVSIDSSAINNGSTDNCGIETITLSQYDFDCSTIGSPVTVTMTVTDFSGNSSSCDAIVTIADTLAPIPNCQNVAVYLDATGNISIDSSDINNGSTDNCGIETITLSQYDFDCSDLGSPVTVTMTVTDFSGNSSSCDAIVTVADTLAPIVACQAITIQLDASGNASIVASEINNGSTDNCDVAPIMSLSQTAFDCSSLGANNITLYVEDASGNVDSCVAIVTVEDLILPILSCLSDTVVNPNAANCQATIDLASIVATDNCSLLSLTWTMSGATVASSPSTGFNHPGNYSFNSGVTTITYTATDVSGNIASCSFTVTVTDTESPVIVGCPSDQTLTNDLGICGAVVSWNITATDNCGVPTITSSHNSGAVFPVGITTVTYTATDAIGNTSTCSFTITITDTEFPVITGIPIPSQSTFCSNEPVTWSLPQAVDNCAVVSFTSDYQSGDSFSVGTTTVTYTAVDAAGNTTTASFDVIVNPLPSVSVSGTSVEGCTSDALTLEVENPNATYSYEWMHNGSLVSSTSSYTLSSVSTSDAGTYQVTATNEFGCIAKTEIELTVKSCDITIFESFSPNHNGQNETFYIEGLENFPNTKVIIFNRWGTEVFKSDDYKNDWDGTSQSQYNVGGGELPEGTYYYLLELGGDPVEETYGKKYKGYVYIKR